MSGYLRKCTLNTVNIFHATGVEVVLWESVLGTRMGEFETTAVKIILPRKWEGGYRHFWDSSRYNQIELDKDETVQDKISRFPNFLPIMLCYTAPADLLSRGQERQDKVRLKVIFSPIPGILQARTLEWVSISFSNAWKWKVKVNSFSRVRLFANP